MTDPVLVLDAAVLSEYDLYSLQTHTLAQMNCHLLILFLSHTHKHTLTPVTGISLMRK